MSGKHHSIIIKRVKKVVAAGHHGGAWKVAYADFVTAMMAFFLLMWLLNATTEEQRKGIADYFDATIPISQISGGGRDALNGSSVFTEDTLAEDGSGGVKPKPREKVEDDAEEGKKLEDADSREIDEADQAAKALEEQRLAEVQEELLQRALEGEGDVLARHIQTRMTPEGLVIELIDADESPLFAIGSADPSPTMVQLLDIVAGAVTQVTNEVAIVGHTDSRAYASARGYTNWELSTDRANTARRLMTLSGLDSGQIAEVAGKADTEPLAADPLAPQNRRISITLLRP